MLLSLGSGALLGLTVLVPLSPAVGADVPTCQGEQATIVGTAGPDRLVGTSGPDVIVGRAGNDVIHGRGGADLICGGEGADELHGDNGDDRLYGQREEWSPDRGAGSVYTPDVLDGGTGDDLLDAGGDDRVASEGSHGVFDYAHSSAPITVDLVAGTATGRGEDTLVSASHECHGDLYCYSVEVVGSRYDDSLLGSEENDHLMGGAGSDHLDGRGGDDYLAPDPAERTSDAHRPAGDDVVLGGAGDDFVYSRNGRDQLFGDDGFDQIWALEGGPTEVHGGGDHDRLVVVFPSDPGFVIDGGPGDNDVQIEGSRDPDAAPLPTSATLTMSDGSVVADGTAWGQILHAQDVSLGAGLRWTYVGTAAPESVEAYGATRLHATTFGGDDRIVGSEYADRIDAGSGDDEVYGQGGRDTCRHAEKVVSCEVTD